MTDPGGGRVEVIRFGSDWRPDPDLLRLVTDYLVNGPEQGEWAWEEHCEGLAGGILHAMHEAGIDLPGSDEPKGV